METILIVDDSLLTRNFLKENLLQKNYNVLEAQTGEDALEIMGSKPVDLVLLDKNLPGINGMETFGQIKQMKLFHPPVIMITADSDLPLAVEFMKSGGADFMVKPINVELLMIRIENVIKSLRMFKYQMIEQKKIENELKIKDKAVRSSLNAIAISDINGNLNYVNPAFLQLWGYQMESEVLGKQAVEFWHVKKQALQVINSLKTQGSWRGELIGKRKDGTLFDADLSAKVVLDDQDKPQFMMASFLDITEQKRIEKRLRESEAHLKQMMDLSPVAKCAADNEGQIWYMNHRFVETFGYELEDIPTVEAWFTRAYPDPTYRSDALVRWQSAIERSQFNEGRIEAGEYNITCKNGSVRIIEITATQLGGKIIGAFIDITEKKESEILLRESEQKFRSLAENLPDIIVRFDRQLRHIYVSHQIERHSTMTPEMMLGKTNHELNIPKHHTDKWEIALQEVFISGKSAVIDYGYHGGKHFESRLIPEFDANGSVQTVLGIVRDITENKKHEAFLKESKKIAEEANRTKSNFLASMSHEFRTPLNSILGYAQLLQQDKNSNPFQHNAADTIYYSGSHLLMMINDILDLSKIEANYVRLEPSELYLSVFLNKIIEIIKVKADEKSIQLNTMIDPNLPKWIYADEKRLRQVLLNLLNNAVKFTSLPEASISFRITANSNCEISDNFNQKSMGCLSFEIEDEGMGIPQDQLEAIFLPFHQVREQFSNQEGTGLGLSISQKLVRLMGGKISVESVVGKGSVFQFCINVPFVDCRENAETNHSKNLLEYIGSSLTILVVDDNRENRFLLRDILSSLGFIVIEAVDGKEAIDKALEHHPELIFMDMLMPVLDGFSGIMKIRQTPVISNIPIIGISASLDNTNLNRCIEAGANECILKPLNINELHQAIQKYIKVKWVFDDEKQMEKTNVHMDSEVVPPEYEELTELLAMANIGDVVGIQHYVSNMGNRDLKMIPFCEKLDYFAKNFMIDELQSFIMKFSESKKHG
ncbi:MAG: response regulator [Desulfobacterales bacterium]|nr:response regulator [Desulfobacterales bacterium]